MALNQHQLENVKKNILQETEIQKAMGDIPRHFKVAAEWKLQFSIGFSYENSVGQLHLFDGTMHPIVEYKFVSQEYLMNEQYV